MENQEVMQDEAMVVEAMDESTNTGKNGGVIGLVLGGVAVVVGAVVFAYNKWIKPKKSKDNVTTEETVNEEDPDAWKETLQEAATEEID